MSAATGGGAWRSAAACAGLGPGLFYDTRARSIAAAKWICLDILKADARALVTVASKAQAAVDYLNVLAGYSPDPMAEVADAA